ncbi:F-box/FBD/LRR-repeat protein At3g14710 [Cajanus cajan]|uniref:F-box/FBD/LRR-repeat protein At3g14710 n=1 Tax=Cajanus cajan TaxID=3821 RepID=UPI00098DBAA3|nr:F-box/FBD/LRR-repeat protein At3g14710 [Cajanus cajan]
MLHFEDRDSHWRNRHNMNKKIMTRFVQFVNRVLLLHSLNASNIQSFSLSISVFYKDLCPLNRWISDVLNRGVKELCMNLTVQLEINAHSFLESPNLEKLKLRNCSIRIPTSRCLSSLTVLKFFGVTLISDPSNRSQKLILNFPVLRTYEAEDCTWVNVKSVTFEVPLLKVLSVKLPSWSTFTLSRTKFKFRASRLTQFSYGSYMLPGMFTLELDSSAHIASANISPGKFNGENNEETAFLAYKLLEQFHSNMQCLKFRRSEILEVVKGSIVAGSLKFEMLSHLELGNVAGEILLMFLMCTPFLKTLILEVLIQFKEEVLVPKLVPACFESNLQVVQFGRLNGDEHEMRFVKHVLEKALVLETVKYSVSLELLEGDASMSFRAYDCYIQ